VNEGPLMNKYDLAVLGGGPGGYVAAIRASQLGFKTAIIDKDRLGGVCLNWGCIPTKALLRNAEVLQTIKDAGKFGITIDGYSIDMDKTIKRSRQASDRLSKGVEYLMKKNKITYFKGTGTLVRGSKIKIEKTGKKETISASKIIVATGGHAKTLSGVDFDGVQIIGAKKAMTLTKIPKRMIIVGGGAVGIEFAYYYNMYGSKVDIIEMLPNILPTEDIDISKELEKEFKKSGIKIHTGTRVEKIERLKSKVKVFITRNGQAEILEGDIVLLAVGVSGNVEGIGLEAVGVKVNAGAIEINEYCQTSAKDIYAIGDVTGPPWLAHVASSQGLVAAEHAANRTPVPVDYSSIPGCTYCQPQVASVGLTESDARAEGLDIKVGRFDFRNNSKALATGEHRGFVKFIFDNTYGELVGCHMIGPDVTELIAEVVTAKSLETTWQDLGKTMHAHPTLSESIMEAALDAYDEAIQH
jgi:dihydrolipoamide dehydrogenase